MGPHSLCLWARVLGDKNLSKRLISRVPNLCCAWEPTVHSPLWSGVMTANRKATPQNGTWLEPRHEPGRGQDQGSWICGRPRRAGGQVPLGRFLTTSAPAFPWGECFHEEREHSRERACVPKGSGHPGVQQKYVTWACPARDWVTLQEQRWGLVRDGWEVGVGERRLTTPGSWSEI